MRLHIWDMVTLKTTAYHDGGSVIALAETKERAMELLADRVESFEDASYMAFEVTAELCDVFADTGCCG